MICTSVIAGRLIPPSILWPSCRPGASKSSNAASDGSSSWISSSGYLMASAGPEMEMPSLSWSPRSTV